jgi:hypothetical protein
MVVPRKFFDLVPPDSLHPQKQTYFTIINLGVITSSSPSSFPRAYNTVLMSATGKITTISPHNLSFKQIPTLLTLIVEREADWIKELQSLPPKHIISPLYLIQKDLTRMIPGVEETLPLLWRLEISSSCS